MHKLFSTRHRLFSNATHTRTQISRNSVGNHSTFYTIFAQLSMTFQSVGKKNFNVHSTHYTQFKTSTSAGIIFETIWLILIGSIWHCLHVSQNIWTILTHQSKCQQKQFLMRMCPSTHDKSWHPEKEKILFLSVSTLNNRRGTQKNCKRKNQKVVLTNNHTNPSILQ